MSEPRSFEHRDIPAGLGTRNTGDDAAAAAEHNSQFAQPDTELEEKRAVSNRWRPAESLLVLKKEVNAMAPDRDDENDGIVGDAAHQSRSSDHNPWVRDGGIGVVTAIDITHDPDNGCDAGVLAETLRTGKDKRIKYIIWNRRISASAPISGQPAWAWRKYTGANPHDHHMHLSVQPEKELYDSKETWNIKPAPTESAAEAAVAAGSPATGPGSAPGAPASAAPSSPDAAAPVSSAAATPSAPAETKSRAPAGPAKERSPLQRLAHWLGLSR